MLNRLKKCGVDLAGLIFNADKGYDGERNFESLSGIYVLPNIKQITNANSFFYIIETISTCEL
jgi:hypothetical protein